MYMSNKEESKAIREMMKEKYPDLKLVKNSHGRGTAYGWIHVIVVYPDWFGMGMNPDQIWDFSRDIYYDIKKAVGRQDLHDDIRTDYFCENILFSLYSRDEYNKRTGKDLKEWTFEKKYEKKVFKNE